MALERDWHRARALRGPRWRQPWPNGMSKVGAAAPGPSGRNPIEITATA
jgi:hypothetical protein